MTDDRSATPPANLAGVTTTASFDLHAAHLVMRGVRVANSGVLRGSLPQGAVVADIFLGAWRPHSIATQVAGALGLIVPAPEVAAGAPVDREGYGRRVGALVDAEAIGDKPVLRAWDLARQLADAGRRVDRRMIYVVAPSAAIGWEPEEAALIRFLAQALAPERGGVVLVALTSIAAAEPPGCHVQWTTEAPKAGGDHVHNEGDSGSRALDHVPGIVSGALARDVGGELADYVLLDDDRLLIGPDRRGHDGQAAQLGLARAARHDEWLRAYEQCRALDAQIDRSFLIRQAWKSLELGAGGLALRLADRAARAAVGQDEIASLRIQTHHMRIALGRFGEVVRDDRPPSVLSPTARGLYLQGHGWALVMVGKHHRARRELTAARSLLQGMRGTPEELYLLNITALNLLRLGDIEGALALEREIEDGLGRLREPDRQLEYINALNIARLQRRRGDMDSAAAYYARAFATTAGARSESDAVFANFSLGKLELERGRPRLAFRYLLRAALHFSASAVPEGMSPRLVRTIAGSGPIAVHERPTAVAQSLLAELRRLADDAFVGTLDREIPSGTPPVFIRAADPRASGIAVSARAVGDEGWGLVVAPTRVGAEPGSAEQEDLRIALGAFLGRQVGHFETAVVDDRFGSEIPCSAGQLLDVALRWGITEVRHGERQFRLDRTARHELLLASHVSLGPAVERILVGPHGGTVFFKRYLAPVAVETGVAELLYALHAASTVRELVVAGANAKALVAVDDLRFLEARRVVSIELGEPT